MISFVLSGGGIKGAFEVGVLKYIYEKRKDLYNRIELVIGTSVGALNASLFVQGDFELLEEIWTNRMRSRRSILRNWFLGYLEGFFRGGLYNMKPLGKLIYEYVDKERLINSKMKLYTCSVDIDTGELVYASNSYPYLKDIEKYILSSATIPTVAPPVRVGNRRLVDGGVKEPIPVEYAVKNARYTKYFIIVLASKLHRRREPFKGLNLWKVINRSVDLMFDEIFENDVKRGVEKYWNGKSFVIIEPKEVVFDSTFDVKKEKILKAIEDGYKKAEELLQDIKVR